MWRELEDIELISKSNFGENTHSAIEEDWIEILFANRIGREAQEVTT